MSLGIPAKHAARVTGLPRKHFSAATSVNNVSNRFQLFDIKHQGNYFRVPKNMTILPLIEGKGGNGTYQTGAHDYREGYVAYSVRQWAYFPPGSTSGTLITDPRVDYGFIESNGSVPSNYCTAITDTPDGNGGYTREQTCYTFGAAIEDYGDFMSAVPGTSINIITPNKTIIFPGGDINGGIAPVKKEYGIRVTPDSLLTITITGVGAANQYVKVYY